MVIEYKKISEIYPNGNNPRKITEAQKNKLKKSIIEFPEMLDIRPIIIDENNIILGGNMRYSTLVELGYEEIPTIKIENLSAEKKSEFIIKDNLSYGEWDWEVLSLEWDSIILDEWGMEFPGFDLNEENYKDDFFLSNEEKAPIQKLTFTLADQQVIEIENAISDIQNDSHFKWMETYGNENKNGNALALIIQQWVEQKK